MSAPWQHRSRWESSHTGFTKALRRAGRISASWRDKVVWDCFHMHHSMRDQVHTIESLVQDKRASKFYIGLTTQPLWRWFSCKGHTMTGHKDAGYDSLWVLTMLNVSYAQAAG